MKTSIKVFIATFMLAGILTSNAQQKCNETLSLFAGNVTSKNFEAAKPQLMYLRENCATINSAIYAHGETVLKHELKNAANKKEAASALIQLYKDRIKNVPSKTKKGAVLSKIGAVMLTYDIGSLKEQYEVFDEAFTTDLKNVKHPRYIYQYFELYYKMYTSDTYTISLESLIEKYEMVNEKFAFEKQRLSKLQKNLQTKKDAGQTLTSKEVRKGENARKNIEAIGQFSKNMTVLLEKVATCETLVPLFKKQLEAKRDDLKWLRRAAGRLDAKTCSEDPLFLELVEAIDSLEPTANSKFYLYKIYKRKGNNEKATFYLEQYLALETDAVKKGKMFNNLGKEAVREGKKSKARQWYIKAAKIKESSGKAYISLARLYASSANACGTNEFMKRIVYWKAAETARKALQTSSSAEANDLIKSYMQLAPDKVLTFNEGYKGGEKITLNCWVGGFVIVPKL